MSRFSGKCDLYDCEVMIQGNRFPNYWEGLDLYIYKDPDSFDAEKIEITCAKDLVPYYPFVECLSYGSSDGKRKVYIGDRSFITTENKYMLNAYKEQLVKIYNKCKRKKIPYNAEEAWKEVDSWNPREDIYELAKRVGENGKKASIDGLTWSDIVRYYRNDWIDCLVENGFDKEWAEKWVAEH